MCEFLFLKFMCRNGNAVQQNGGAFITGDRIDFVCIALVFDRISAARFLLYISDFFLLFSSLFCRLSLLHLFSSLVECCCRCCCYSFDFCTTTRIRPSNMNQYSPFMVVYHTTDLNSFNFGAVCTIIN